MKDKVEVFIFRHGETDWNREGRFQGHTDIPLNNNGIQQAHLLALEIQKLKPEIMITSDLSRAKQTAQIANAHLALPLFESAMLRECRLGEPEGLLRSEINQKYGPLAWSRWLSTEEKDQDFAFPGGESKREHLIRQRSYLENFLLQNQSWPQYGFPHHPSKVAVSTHGGSLRRLVHHCQGAPTKPIPIPNCALYKIYFDMTERLWIYGEALYLSSSPEEQRKGVF